MASASPGRPDRRPTPTSRTTKKLTGTASWSGQLLGLTPSAEAVAGHADLIVRLATLDGDLDFTNLEAWGAGQAPGPTGTNVGATADLSYGINVKGNTFARTGGDAGAVTRRLLRPLSTRAWAAWSSAPISALPSAAHGKHHAGHPPRPRPTIQARRFAALRRTAGRSSVPMKRVCCPCCTGGAARPSGAGFWLARWLARHGIDPHVIHASSIPVNREQRRAKDGTAWIVGY